MVHKKGGDLESSGRGTGGDHQAHGVPESSTLSLMEHLGSLEMLGKPCALGDRDSGAESLEEELESEGLHWQLVLVGWRGQSTPPGWDWFSRSQALAWSWWQGAWMMEQSPHLLGSWPHGRSDWMRGIEKGGSSQALFLSACWVTVYPPVLG